MLSSYVSLLGFPGRRAGAASVSKPVRGRPVGRESNSRQQGKALDASTRFIFLDKTTDYHPLSAPFELSGMADDENGDSGIIATKTYL